MTRASNFGESGAATDVLERVELDVPTNDMGKLKHRWMFPPGVDVLPVGTPALCGHRAIEAFVYSGYIEKKRLCRECARIWNEKYGDAR